MRKFTFRTRAARTRRDEKGYVMVLTAMLLVPLLVVAGLAVDFGGWYTEGSRMQRAADAAALAGVIWLPDLVTATAVAKTSAKQNGYDETQPGITVTVTQLGKSRLSVNITDTAGKVYLAKFVRDSVRIARTANAEYNLPIPLGSPKNYFGTGNMIAGAEQENFYAAINGSCYDKNQGDPFAVKYAGGSVSSCGSYTANPEYKASGPQYQYYIEVPPNRTSNIIVHLWNPESAAVDNGITPKRVCTAASATFDPGACDTATGKVNSNKTDSITATFTLRSPDDTPLNDDDNLPFTCNGKSEQTYDSAASLGTLDTLLGRFGWARFCTIPTTAAPGTYLLDIRNQPNEAKSQGLNAYSVMADYAGSNGATCDARTDPKCPRVYGKDFISIYANTASKSANFYLAEIGPLNGGKTLEVTLFDPGEGGSNIRLILPNGSTYATFDWQDMGTDNATPGNSGTNTTSLDVTNSRFNGHYVRLTMTLPANYGTIYSQFWWKIQYNFTSGSVTDRTTWGVRMLGTPVHLV